MNLMRLALLTWLFALACSYQTDQRSAGRIGKPLFIGNEEESSTLVKLKKADGVEHTCEFKYVTKDVNKKGDGGSDQQAQLARQKEQQQGMFHGIHRDVDTILAKLSGICIRKTFDYWKYELCFESRISQSHGRDSFSLGTYAGMEGSKQLYDDGTKCDAVAGSVGRESRVEFVCDSTLRIISVTEVSTCSYKIYVSTPLVCGHPDFMQSTRNIPGKVGSKKQSGPPKESWFLELTQLASGQVSCSLAVLRPDGFDTFFEEFELSLAVTVPSEMKLETDMIRTKGRRSLSKSSKHYEVMRMDENSKLVMRNGREFQGVFTYAMIQAVVSDE